jgi:hypothetical protein
VAEASGTRLPRADRIIAAAAAAVLIAILLFHVRSYFFLLDDFIILGEAQARGASGLLSAPLFNFYRPAGPLWLLSLQSVFGWTYPAGYAAAAALLHVACALLVAAWARTLTADRSLALVAGTLFLVSAWATEPYLWVSGVYDLLATIGLVCALTLAVRAIDQPPPRGVVLGAGAIACALVAMLAKEIGVLAPVLFALTLLLTRPRADWRRAGSVACFAGLSLAAVSYLLWREHLLPGFAGGYGDLGTLVRRGSLVQGAISYLRALVVLPFPASPAAGWMNPLYIGAVVFGGCVVPLAVRAVRTRPRLAILCLAAMALSVAPVLWVSLIEGSSAGNRFLYFAGVWFSILLAAGLTSLSGRLRAGLFAVLTGVALVSVAHQARIWSVAAELSRASVDQLEPYRGSAAPLFVDNLPLSFAEGPYILNPLAFRYYRGGQWPTVQGRGMTLTFDRPQPRFSFWVDDPVPVDGAKRIQLTLPIWTGESRPFGAIDAPPDGTVVTQPFTIRGWTIDAGAREGTGVESVRVYAHSLPASNGDPTALGSARYGDPRPDVAGRFGDRFLASGFHLEAAGLRPGRYRILVSTRRPLARGADVPLSVNVEVR